VRHGPTEQELEAVKKNLTGGFPLRIDSNRNIAGYLSVIGFYGLPLDYLDRFIDNIESVSVNDIKDAFRRRISVDDFVVILVGPFETENQ
jgi:zinc protease